MHGLVPLPRRADKPLSTTPSVPSRPSRPHAALPPLFTDTLLREACLWLYRQRQHYPADADIWHLRFHRETLFPQILKSLNTGTWQFSPLSLVRKANGDTVAIWSAADALVLKCLTLLLSPVLPVHPQCEHVKGHGGGRQSVKRVHQSICNRGWKYVCRTDIKGYYGNISKNLLYSQLLKHVTDPRLTLLLWQFLHYSVEEGGTFHTPAKGISRSSPLSPLLAAFHLTEMDACFAKMPGIRYARYMDDFIILTRTRRQLRRGVRQLNTWFSGYGFRQHPDKTFIGPLKKGFDWMGFWFTDQGCRSVSPRSGQNHRDTLRRLYEQIRKQPADVQAARADAYVTRWNRWVQLVIGVCPVFVPPFAYAAAHRYAPGFRAAGCAGGGWGACHSMQ
ncbi:hypothetical protein JYY36_002935 [Salmonella enterica subsp. diarizonae serovar 50:z:-]|nr:hypothetical protein [Salmonella enterica]EDC7491839.1 hypothetical protein [Salmonella enterica]EHC2385180.1 hypothetical protein [Salmonella enterica]EHC9775735.1 hypothetical protein [Salmonella enterica subsp. diarizonae serovar 50:z:-]